MIGKRRIRPSLSEDIYWILLQHGNNAPLMHSLILIKEFNLDRNNDDNNLVEDYYKNQIEKH